MGKERSELPWGPAGGPELSELCQCPFSLPRAGRGFSGQRSGWVTMRIQALLPPGCGSTPWYPPPVVSWSPLHSPHQSCFGSLPLAPCRGSPFCFPHLWAREQGQPGSPQCPAQASRCVTHEVTPSRSGAPHPVRPARFYAVLRPVSRGRCTGPRVHALCRPPAHTFQNSRASGEMTPGDSRVPGTRRGAGRAQAPDANTLGLGRSPGRPGVLWGGADSTR